MVTLAPLSSSLLIVRRRIEHAGGLHRKFQQIQVLHVWTSWSNGKPVLQTSGRTPEQDYTITQLQSSTARLNGWRTTTRAKARPAGHTDWPKHMDLT